MVVKSLDRFITSTPGVCGGKPCIAGRRIRVLDVVIWHEHHKWDADQIAAEYDLSHAEIYAALAWYFEHRDLIDSQIQAEADFVAAFRKNYASPLERKSAP